MEKVIAGLVVSLGVVLVAGLMFFFAALLGTFFGAFSGWVVGLLFEETILTFLAAMGLTGFKMWEVGASLGFLGSFFKSYSAQSSK